MPRPRKKPSPKPAPPAFNAQAYLDSAGIAKKVTDYAPLSVIFAQGDPGDSVMYIQKGTVRLSVLSHAGKEAIVGVLGPGDFIGEGALAGQPIRMGTATLHTSPGLGTSKFAPFRFLCRPEATVLELRRRTGASLH